MKKSPEQDEEKIPDQSGEEDQISQDLWDNFDRLMDKIIESPDSEKTAQPKEEE